MTRTVSLDGRTSSWDEAVRDLAGGLPSWRSASLTERTELLTGLRRRIGPEASGIVALTADEQGFDPTGLWAAESWSALFAMVQTVRSLEWVLGKVAAGAEPLAEKAFHRRPGGQVVVDVFPVRWDERLLFAGYRAQVWMQPGVSVQEVRAGAAAAFRGAGFDHPGVALLLAGGNIANLTVRDVLHLLYGRGCVVAVKMSPALTYLRPAMERILGDFVARGWVRFVDETPDAGAYLARHPGIDRVHLTGSATTYDAVVWGSDSQAADRRANGTPLLNKTVTAELGGVSPMIVVPGDWSRRDLQLQADRIVYGKLMYCGHTCGSTQILVLPQGWPLASPLLDEIRRLMRSLEPRPRYYPGTDAKVTQVLVDECDVEVLLPPNNRLLVPALDPASEARMFREEVFSDVLGVVHLPASSVDEYLSEATGFANERLTGTLGASILVDPTTARDHASALDRTIAGLRYGSIGINEWTVVNSSLGYTTWGGYPGHTPDAIGSGVGVVENSFLLHRPQKSVITNQFHPRLKPMTTVTHRSATALSTRVVDYLTTDNVRLIPSLVATALRA